MLRIKNWCFILMATFHGLTTNYLRWEKKLEITAPITNRFTPGSNGEFPVLQFQDHTQAEIMQAKTMRCKKIFIHLRRKSGPVYLCNHIYTP